jgi:hypothetical protein
MRCRLPGPLNIIVRARRKDDGAWLTRYLLKKKLTEADSLLQIYQRYHHDTREDFDIFD